jgi:S-adenosylmethionine hydrolase
MPAVPQPRIITLLTDFGLRDHFVGVMKGVIAAIAPRARVIDISHEIEAHRVGPARFLLAQSWPHFPKGTIHVAVVDPGVGSERRAILVEAAGHCFVGPDNGLFTDVLVLPKARAREITNRELMRAEVSATFHGRDLFAPVAAHLAAGVRPAQVGRRIDDAFRLGGGKVVRTGRRYWSGEVAYIDRFGNLITNIETRDFPDLAARRFVLRVGMIEIDHLSPHYASGAPGEPIALIGSAGTVEIAVNQGSAAKRLGIEIGAPVELEMP